MSIKNIVEVVLVAVSHFANKPWFLRVCSTSHENTVGKKEKLLIMSNFSFSYSVFYLFGELSAIFIIFEIVVCEFFQFGRRSKIYRFGMGLEVILNLS